jgi:DNA/RNA-binding domain of Phe-tRNA-synthetase-like protein
MLKQIKIEIAPDIRDRFPGIRCGGFRASGLNVIDAHAVCLPGAAIRDALTSDGFSIETVTRDSRIAAWRSAIQACGLKAAKIRGSAEQLVRRTLRGDSIGGPALVQMYCGVSAKTVAPLGGYDVDRLPSSTIQLRFAQPTDIFEPIGGDVAAMPLSPTIPVYAASDQVLCWMFNVRDARATALSDSTTEGLFLTEALTPLQAISSTEALTTLRALLETAGAAVSRIAWNEGDGCVSLPADW